MSTSNVAIAFDQTEEIALVNDQVRFALSNREKMADLENNDILVSFSMSSSLLELATVPLLQKITKEIQGYDNFKKTNVSGLRDFGVFEVDGHPIFFKINYFNNSLDDESNNPSDLLATRRLFSIGLISDF